ncbi:MAG: radical SAM protein [Bacteroidales bacterium]|nr:radical SAM protein [Bacteroidales bacterium]
MKYPEKIGFRKRLALDLFAKYHQDRVKTHELKVLFWECTLRCNLSCKHCGSDCKSESGIADMPKADFFKVIDSITPHINPNKVMITFSCGEPLMRNDLEECGLELYRRGFPWGLVSNGMALTPQRFDALIAAGLHSITISLDGFAEQHNMIRGNPKSFDNALNAIKMIVHEKDIIYDVVTCVTPDNFSSLEAFKNLLIDTGVKYWRIFTIFPSGRAAENDHLQLSNKQTIELLEFIKQTRKENKIKLNFACEGFLGNYETEVRDNFYYCAAGVNVASILIDGNISGCTSIRHNFYQGNIYHDDFMTVWNNKFETYRNRDWTKTNECQECKMFKYCLGGGMHLRGDNKEMLDCLYLRITDKKNNDSL